MWELSYHILIVDFDCRGFKGGHARHRDLTKECPHHLAPAWTYWSGGKWNEAGEKMVVKCVKEE